MKRMIGIISTAGMLLATGMQQPALAKSQPIKIKTPDKNEIVGSPVKVAGATDYKKVYIFVENQSGNVVGRATAKNECGKDCHGELSKKVSYDLNKTRDGQIRVCKQNDPVEGMCDTVYVTLTP